MATMVASLSVKKFLDQPNKVIFSLKLLYVWKHFLNLMNILQILEELKMTKLWRLTIRYRSHKGSHSTIHKEESNKMQQCIKILLFHIYMKINMFRVTHRPSSGA